MAENTPTPAPEMPATEPNKNNKWLVPVIVIVAVIVVIGGYTTYNRWQQERAVKGFLNQLGVNGDAANVIGKGVAQYADQMAGEAAKEEAEAKKSPADKFKDAETTNIGDSGNKALAEEIAPIIKTVFGDDKIVAYTSGYMGMDSGSGVIQFMTPDALAVSQANDLSKELQNNGFQIISNTMQEESTAIAASKGGKMYTFGFNKDEQEITVVIINTNKQ